MIIFIEKHFSLTESYTLHTRERERERKRERASERGTARSI